ELVFAYSPDKLSGLGEDAVVPASTPQTRARFKLDDPSGYARDRLRERAVRATTPKAADAYVAQRRAYYAESYAGDDVFDVLGIDLYHPIGRAADASDLRQFGLLLRVVAEEARAH